MSLTPIEPGPREGAAMDANRFDAANSEQIRWHAHKTGQFILVESGASHLYTELGTWIIPARRIAWVPPGVLHASRSSGNGKGWVVIPPMKLADLPSRVCVLRASVLMIGALQRVTQVQPHDRLGALLWRVIAEELRGAQPE